jgi:hypothetical protein
MHGAMLHADEQELLRSSMQPDGLRFISPRHRLGPLGNCSIGCDGISALWKVMDGEGLDLTVFFALRLKRSACLWYDFL